MFSGNMGLHIVQNLHTHTQKKNKNKNKTNRMLVEISNLESNIFTTNACWVFLDLLDEWAMEINWPLMGINIIKNNRNRLRLP